MVWFVGNPPDPNRLLERAAADIEAGEPWRAKNRLRQYLAQLPFDHRFALRLGELELVAGELPAAARWLWVAGSEDPAHQPLIQRFLERQRDGDALWRALPGSLRRGVGDVVVPEYLAEELRQRKIDPQARQAQRQAQGQRRSDESRWFRFGCGVFVFICLIALVGAAVELVRAILR